MRDPFRIVVLVLGFSIGVMHGQSPLSVDTTFRVTIERKGVSSILPLHDGNILLSGQLEVPGELFFRGSVKVDPFGNRIESFPAFPFSSGGGLLTAWEDRIYVTSGQIVRRLDQDGFVDTTFHLLNDDPLFLSLQGGDYHVYPDGGVLMSGAHELFDTTRGFVGLYNLIWFDNTGHVDTTKIHRKGNGVTNQIEPLANGQFLVFGNGSQYEGQPVGRIFRINADGSLDPSLQTGVIGGAAWSFLPLSDGRFYASGVFMRSDDPSDTLRLARFLPNGDLDPTFNDHIPLSTGDLPGYGIGAGPGKLLPWSNGSILAMGNFQLVAGESRKGICVLDSTGQLLPEFDECGVGPFSYQGYTEATISGYVPAPDGKAYVFGVYRGYNDGTTNDTLQRFVTRLYGPDFTTAVAEELATEKRFSTYPNPTSGMVTFAYALERPQKDAFVVLRDLVGRTIATLPMQQGLGQVEYNTGALAKGVYTVSYTAASTTLWTERLIVQ